MVFFHIDGYLHFEYIKNGPDLIYILGKYEHCYPSHVNKTALQLLVMENFYVAFRFGNGVIRGKIQRILRELIANLEQFKLANTGYGHGTVGHP
ncbi:hypothetical protein C5167_013095 [Papaver somniferum]|uniref:Uncharacterized protein n=1 Tax=Papaver somniferum TaxID=3469 RepID=A0A4Y7J3D0_PAPSO|nr:hypothetical protein C5167_013095 [Papaver somniferum]